MALTDQAMEETEFIVLDNDLFELDNNLRNARSKLKAKGKQLNIPQSTSRESLKQTLTKLIELGDYIPEGEGDHSTSFSGWTIGNRVDDTSKIQNDPDWTEWDTATPQGKKKLKKKVAKRKKDGSKKRNPCHKVPIKLCKCFIAIS